jgi:hypothetical protein
MLKNIHPGGEMLNQLLLFQRVQREFFHLLEELHLQLTHVHALFLDLLGGRNIGQMLLLLERKKETLRKGWGEVPPWVFTSETGSPFDQANFHHRVWKKLLAKAGLRYIRVSDLWAYLCREHGF